MSLFVLDLWTDSIVCEYTERTSFADDGYEMIRRILLFYNARCLYENNKKGIFSYFSRMNCIYLLEDTPEFLRDRDMIKTTGLGNKSKGYSATKGINEYADKLTRDWLMQPVTIIQTVNKLNNLNCITIPQAIIKPCQQFSCIFIHHDTLQE